MVLLLFPLQCFHAAPHQHTTPLLVSTDTAEANNIYTSVSTIKETVNYNFSKDRLLLLKLRFISYWCSCTLFIYIDAHNMVSYLLTMWTHFALDNLKLCLHVLLNLLWLCWLLLHHCLFIMQFLQERIPPLSSRSRTTACVSKNSFRPCEFGTSGFKWYWKALLEVLSSEIGRKKVFRMRISICLYIIFALYGFKQSNCTLLYTLLYL